MRFLYVIVPSTGNLALGAKLRRACLEIGRLVLFAPFGPISIPCANHSSLAGHFLGQMKMLFEDSHRHPITDDYDILQDLGVYVFILAELGGAKTRLIGPTRHPLWQVDR